MRGRGKAAVRRQTRALADNVTAVAATVRAAVPAPAQPHGRPAVLVLMGLPGSGKSHVARLLAVRLHAAHVASDHLRSQLFIAASYTREESAAVFRLIDGLVGALLDEGHRVIVDATNLKREQRAAFERLAGRRGVPLAHLLVTAEEAAIRARLASRRTARAAGDHSEADESVYAAMRSRGFEEPLTEYLTIRSGPDVDEQAGRVAHELERMWSATPVFTRPGSGR